MEELTVRDLFNKLCAEREITMQVGEQDVPNLHSRLCKMRSALDNDFNSIGEANPFITADDRILSKILSRQHLEDGSKLVIVKFSLGVKHIRTFTMITPAKDEPQ